MLRNRRARRIQGTKVMVPYDPAIDPADFTHVLSNKYYALKPGMIADYEEESAIGVTRKQIEVTGETKTVMGVTTLVVRDRGWLNRQLVEDKSEWVAQDRHGNVWYFGEAVHYKDGELIDHDESWEAGIDGAKPGIKMLNDPKAGLIYHHEYYPGRVEDFATVVAVGIGVSLPRGPYFENCVHIREWSALDENYIKNEYSCVGVGAAVLKEQDAERVKLVTFKRGWLPAIIRPVPGERTPKDGFFGF